MSKVIEDEKLKMVGWYDPSQLLDTAKKTAISTTVGKFADPRLGMADPKPGKIFDYSKELTETKEIIAPNEDIFAPNENTERSEIWIDYVADVGDGWNPTYAVAYTLARETLEVGDAKEVLKRGEILIFGGDGVYPTASSNEYKRRLLMPYRMAFKASGTTAAAFSGAVNLKKEPHIFALPGNHDWYDSLVAFKELFCSHIFNDRRFADAWRTRQKRSYFTLKLPGNWWLLAVDLQLSHNIDVSQLIYFESIVGQMEKGDKIIFCVPEPYWVKSIKYDEFNLAEIEEKEDSIQKLEDFFEKRGVEVKVYIAGDLHHYRRFQNVDRVQKITSGGGGAFLHPTHDFDFIKHDNDKTKGFSLESDYPDFNESRRQDWKNFWFFWNNPKFGIVTAIIYAILAWLINGRIAEGKDFSWGEAVLVTVDRIIFTPLATIVVVLMLLAVILFTDSSSWRQKWLGGFAHGLVHLAAIFFVGWWAYRISIWIIKNYSVVDPTNQNLIWFACVLVIPAIGGYLIGAIIMGLYLFISLHIFGRHDNEAFSALKIEDYKNFLRLHIDKSGALTIYPIKIERVPRDWKPMGKDRVEYYEPETAIKPELIEKPISV